MNKIKLLNGRGQIGCKLNKILSEKAFILERDVLIYHTWNIENKSWEIQLNEYNKFKKFVTENNDKRIIFVSTNSQKESYYVKFKQLSESFLIGNCKNCLVLKFPTLIGKGIFYDFKADRKKPFGEMNIMTVQDACNLIVDNLNYNGILKSKTFLGDKINAKIVYELVKI